MLCNVYLLFMFYCVLLNNLKIYMKIQKQRKIMKKREKKYYFCFNIGIDLYMYVSVHGHKNKASSECL